MLIPVCSQSVVEVLILGEVESWKVALQWSAAGDAALGGSSS